MSNRIFQGKLAIVTGAASGIGEATAKMFAAEGAATVLLDRSAEVRSLSAELSEAGNPSAPLVGDIIDPAISEQAVDTAKARFGTLDFAFNNAGISGKTCSVEDLTVDDWRRVIDVNLNGVFYGNKYQIPAMLESGGGVIVNNSSVMGLKPIPGLSLEYTAAKHGVTGLTRQIAVNYGGKGIRCVAVCPGFIETPLTAPAADGTTTHEGIDWFAARIPLGRTGRPEDVARAVRMLCSDDAAFVNGACLEVDGGFVLA